MEQSLENVVIDSPQSGVARITLNRPERLNALTLGLVNDLHEALDGVDVFINMVMKNPTDPFSNRATIEDLSLIHI